MAIPLEGTILARIRVAPRSIELDKGLIPRPDPQGRALNVRSSELRYRRQ